MNRLQAGQAIQPIRERTSAKMGWMTKLTRNEMSTKCENIYLELNAPQVLNFVAAEL